MPLSVIVRVRGLEAELLLTRAEGEGEFTARQEEGQEVIIRLIRHVQQHSE